MSSYVTIENPVCTRHYSLHAPLLPMIYATLLFYSICSIYLCHWTIGLKRKKIGTPEHLRHTYWFTAHYPYIYYTFYAHCFCTSHAASLIILKQKKKAGIYDTREAAEKAFYEYKKDHIVKIANKSKGKIPASTVLVLVGNVDIRFKMCFPDVYEIVRFGKFAGSW